VGRLGESAGLFVRCNTSGWVAPWTSCRDGTVVVSGDLEGHTFCVALGVDRTSGNIVHPCRVNLFEKPCPRLWTTQEHRDLIIEQLTLNLDLNLPIT
jgi:hypothetical protein